MKFLTKIITFTTPTLFVIFIAHSKPSLFQLAGSPDPHRHFTEDSDMTRGPISPLAQILHALRVLHPTLGLPALFDRMEGRG
jgi:hypothetical protein